MKRILLILTVVLSGVYLAGAQVVTDDTDVQSWNDVQLTVPMSKKVDVFTRLTMRFGKNVTRLNEGRSVFGFVLKPIKSLSISPFYSYVNARNSSSRFRIENRLSLQANYRLPFKKFSLTHRSTYEYRFRGAGDTWRYRAALTYDHDLPKSFIPRAKFFISDEVFYDSATGKFSRNRFSSGITKTVNKNLSVDIYYMHQNDGYAHPGDLHTIWTAWKFHI